MRTIMVQLYTQALIRVLYGGTTLVNENTRGC